MTNTPKKRRVALVPLGCPKNLVDAEVMLGALDAAGRSPYYCSICQRSGVFDGCGYNKTIHL